MQTYGSNGEASQLWAVYKKPYFYYKSHKDPYQYCKSHENLYQYYKSCKNLYQVLQVTCTASDTMKSKIHNHYHHSTKFVAIDIVTHAVHS